MNKKFKLSDLLIGILFTLLFISLGVFFTIHFRFLYYLDIKLLNIPENSGYPKEIILENYNALIDYCSPFFTGTLVFPSLPASTSGISHFAEVKEIFNFFFYMGIACFCLLLPVILYKYKKKDTSFLLVSSITSIILPVLVSLGCSLNFEKAFVIFHKLFFRNNDWLFDPATDPIITILPESFFLHCALLIIAVVILGSLALFITYLHRKSHSQITHG